jgi:protein-disulfide isomerase
MQRLTIGLVALVGVLAGAVGVMLINQAPNSPSESEVRTIVSEMIDARAEDVLASPVGPQSLAEIDPDTLHPIIENYLMANPRILERVSVALQDEIRSAEAMQSASLLADLHSDIYDDPGNVILGNPDGDVTLVELFDYNCTYCRSALPDMLALLQEDEGLRIILKEFPILSQESVDAARVAVVVNQSDADYLAFHQALFTGRGQVTGASAMAAAVDLGLSEVSLELAMADPAVDDVIQRSYAIAQTLNVSGTPTYIIGSEIIPGAVGVDALRERIANVRACGQTYCDG